MLRPTGSLGVLDDELEDGGDEFEALDEVLDESDEAADEVADALDEFELAVLDVVLELLALLEALELEEGALVVELDDTDELDATLLDEDELLTEDVELVE
ncbi:MAG: hypothetical protein QM803_02480 [Rhodocyclaceae bacterium]